MAEQEFEAPFLALARGVQTQSPLRAAITAAYRRPEPECLPPLLEAASLPAGQAASVREVAEDLVRKLRAKTRRGGVENLLQEYSLSSQEGVALMRLAEALLRIPDAATRDALIRDKIGPGDWASHLGASSSPFVNAATWGLLVTGKLASTASETGLSAALTKLLARSGEPVVRAGVQLAMRLMGEQFVVGETIAEALANSRKAEAKGYLYSYDMLGEAALTQADAAAYFAAYEQAIHAIGAAAAGRGIFAGPGISIKLSALHPRYSRAQYFRVMTELLPRLAALAQLAKSYGIGLNIDAEEADRLEISLDLLESLCFDLALRDWNGIGFVVQAYQKRAPFVIDFLIDLARRSGRRLMLRLVKGAYWDSEIKRAQVDGFEGFPVFTRKLHTDVSYLACAQKMLSAPEEIFPQFATHNAQTVASILAMAGENFVLGQYEFQCLHGMGEPLYDEVVGQQKLGRPCRIYAPVGTHETLLAYLVRRLLENGANTSFVNKIADPKVPIETLVADPVVLARAVLPPGSGHEKIMLPQNMFGAARQNSAGLDLTNEQRLASLSASLLSESVKTWRAAPILDAEQTEGPYQPVFNPAEARDEVGQVAEASPDLVARAVETAARAAPAWQATPPAERAKILRRAAASLEAERPAFLNLLVREAGKTIPAAIGEVREAVDFLRYYAAQAETFTTATEVPLGVITAISPWNFPLAIFTGQVSAALAAGNAVIAKPAEQTPLVAALAVKTLLSAGIPAGALTLLPGDGAVGAALAAHPGVNGVVFTGSTQVARAIQSQLAARLNARKMPIPLIAETGGQNAMVVDSSALPEQAVADILASAFDSAGQRCSALRLLLVQEDAADRLLAMLRGAMAELRIGRPDALETDIGPVISAEARDVILAHVASMRAQNFPVHAPAQPDGLNGCFAAPTVIEIPDISVLGPEIFGPVLHVLRYARKNLDEVLTQVNALGYGLTFGIHSRIEETILHLTRHAAAGNIYVNRNIIGAVVGVQPFGGHGLSGTGPKAGGPLYLRRLLAEAPENHGLPTAPPPGPLNLFIRHLEANNIDATPATPYLTLTPSPAAIPLPGPVGETNFYQLVPRGKILCVAASQQYALAQVAATLAAGNTAILRSPEILPAFQNLPETLAEFIKPDADDPDMDAALFQGDPATLSTLLAQLAARAGKVIPVFAPPREDGLYPVEFLMTEVVVSTNTAAAGGNASLMTIG
jgi:RHH-type proline utilization regulon transcriptional repressor/proline dehydrogenase/delta 1-pyrroline-5-carboxylate dehydrogenase